MSEANWPADIVPESGCRLPLADRDNLDAEAQERFDRISAGLDGALAGLRGPTGLSFHSPEVAKPAQALNMYLRSPETIPAALREVAIMTVAREMDCRFEWAAHEPQALKDGVAQDVIDVIKHRAPTDGLPEEYAAVVAFGREVISDHCVTPETFARLATLHEPRMIMDLILLLGNYVSLAVLLLAVDQQLPPGDQAQLPIPGTAEGSSPPAQNLSGTDRNPESGSRLPLVDPASLDEDGKQRYDRIKAGLDGVANGLSGPGGLMLHSPVGSKHALAVNHFLRNNDGITQNLREVAILTVARMMDCGFEWAAHEPIALSADVPQSTIDAIKFRRGLDGVSDAHAEIIELAREVLGKHEVRPATFAKLLDRYPPRTVIELLMLIGNYVSLAILLLAVDQQLPPGDQALLPLP